MPSRQLWRFLVDPRNLNLLTPRELEFEVCSELPPAIHLGLLIDYRIKIPWIGRRRWRTEITEVDPGRRFVDLQLKGPYRSWRHEHQLRAVDERTTEMTDRIEYRMPFGWVGRLASPLVRRQLRQIFSYRRQALDRIAEQLSC